MVEKALEAAALAENDQLQKNKAMVRNIRGSVLEVSEANRRSLMQWCLVAEKQVNNRVLPWSELVDALQHEEEDIALLRRKCSAFDEYLTAVESGQIQRISALDLEAAAEAARSSTAANEEVSPKPASAVQRIYGVVSKRTKKVIKNAGGTS